MIDPNIPHDSCISQSENKPDSLTRTPPKRGFILNRCGVSVDLEANKPLVFRLIDKYNRSTITFAASNEQEFQIWVDFLRFHNLSEDEFWETIECFRNKAVWEKKNGDWVLKNKLV